MLRESISGTCTINSILRAEWRAGGGRAGLTRVLLPQCWWLLPSFPAWVQAPRPDRSASRRGLAFVWLQSQYLKHLDQTEDFAFSPPGPPSTKTLSKNPTQPRPLANLLPLSRMFSVSSAGALFWSGWSPALTTQPSLDAGYCQCPAGPEDKTGADSSFPSPLNLLPFL